MASTYSTNLAIELIGTGDQAGAWGNTTNTNLGTLIEQAISGYVTQAVATGTDTSITIPNGSSGVARNMFIELTGTGGASTNLIVPANKKLYFIYNNTSSGQVTVKVAGQTGVSVPNGKKMVLVSNGTDVVNGLNYIADFGTNSFTVTNLTATSATITTLTSTSAGITTLSGTSANITTLSGTNFSATSLTLTNALGVAQGGTGNTAAPSAGQLLVGNGTGFTLNTLNGGPGVGITNAAGSITITATGTGFIAAVNATSPLQSVGTQSITISIASSTGTGAVVLADNPTMSSATVTNLSSTSANITTLTGTTFGTTATTQLRGASGQITTLTGTNFSATSLTLTNALGRAQGGTGLSTAPTNGQLLIGNGTGYALSTLTAGTGISITNSAGSITISGSSSLTGITTSTATALGLNAGDSVTTGYDNTCIGYDAGTAITTGYDNTVVGHQAGDSILGGYENTCVGSTSGYGITSGYQNTMVGYGAGDVVSTGNSNVFVGRWAGIDITTGSYNTGVGLLALGNAFINTTNSSAFGYNAQVTGSDQVQLGDGSTTTYVYGTVQNRSDLRDKTDVQDTDLGLGFIMALRPRKFRWDMREDYKTPRPGPGATPQEIEDWKQANRMGNLTHDGTHKRNRYHQGLIAQEVKTTMDAMGIDFGGYQDHKIKGGEDVLSLGYDEMIAPLIKAIQELKAEFDEYKRTHP